MELQNGTVHAFEPVQSNLSRLRQNVSKNGYEPFVKVYPFALGDNHRRTRIQMEREGQRATLLKYGEKCRTSPRERKQLSTGLLILSMMLTQKPVG
jgi:FkbM family methyltransferase